MDYLNESVQSTIDLGVTNKFTQLMFDSVETDFKQAYIELRDAKEVYYANP
jgi:phage terminase large subunit